jgi:hypothetical protein
MTALERRVSAGAAPVRSQLGALVSLRWHMVRSRRVRLGLALLAGCIPLAGVAAVMVGRLLPADNAFDVALITPTLFLVAAAVGVLAPLAAGGGNELYPADQLAAYPVRPGTLFAASLLLAPLNLAWLVQLIVMLGVTGFITGGGPRLALSVTTTLAYVAFVTVAGQAIAWWFVGLRRTRAGRRLIWTVAALAGLIPGVLAVTGRLPAALDRAPTTSVVNLLLHGYTGPLTAWYPGMALLLFATAASALAGARLCSWALATAPDMGVHQEGHPVRRRQPRRSAFAELTAVDRASVWRSVPMRRGILVLGLLPGAVAAVAGVDWSSIVLLPGLVASGAGLLFGVNAFCLDGAGAVWLASLPHDPRLGYFAKARVLTEVCTATVLIAVLAAALRAPEPPTLTQLTAVAGSAVACTAAVVATCMRLSIRRPHRADLRGARDTPAPPAAMAVYSVRLSLVTTVTGLVLYLMSYAEPWPWLPLVVAVPLTVRALLVLLRGADEWSVPHVRARVVTAVASG